MGHYEAFLEALRLNKENGSRVKQPNREIQVIRLEESWLVQIGYPWPGGFIEYRTFNERYWPNVERIIANHTKRFPCKIKIEGFYVGNRFDKDRGFCA